MAGVEYLRGSDFETAAADLGVSVAVIKTVAAVEARKSGFIGSSDLPRILFEGHHFHKRTGGRYSEDYPHISYRSWTKSHYKGGRGEYDRVTEAIKIHGGEAGPALLSTSWGMFQIMGFNHEAAGYHTVEDFVNDQGTGEPAQLRAFLSFIKSTGLADELRDHRWEDFARQYNGPGYKRNQYHTRLATHFVRACAEAQDMPVGEGGGKAYTERGDIAAIQAALNVALGDKLQERLVPDGWNGPKTIRAIRMFQKHMNLPENGKANDPQLHAELGLADKAQVHKQHSPSKEEA